MFSTAATTAHDASPANAYATNAGELNDLYTVISWLFMFTIPNALF